MTLSSSDWKVQAIRTVDVATEQVALFVSGKGSGDRAVGSHDVVDGREQQISRNIAREHASIGAEDVDRFEH